MTRQTQLHNWTVPTDGDNDYAETFDNWFTALDESVEIRDERSNLNNYDPVSGEKFYSIDTEEIFIGDGSQWVKKETSGKNPTFNNVDAESVSTEKLDSGRNWVDVLSSRATNLRETNDTGADIIIAVSAEASADGTNIGINPIVNNSRIKTTFVTVGTGKRVSESAVVPAGAVYEIEAFGNEADYDIVEWRELRP